MRKYSLYYLIDHNNRRILPAIYVRRSSHTPYENKRRHEKQGDSTTNPIIHSPIYPLINPYIHSSITIHPSDHQEECRLRNNMQAVVELFSSRRYPVWVSSYYVFYRLLCPPPPLSPHTPLTRTNANSEVQFSKTMIYMRLQRQVNGYKTYWRGPRSSHNYPYIKRKEQRNQLI